jgi:hypothetical protein
MLQHNFKSKVFFLIDLQSGRRNDRRELGHHHHRRLQDGGKHFQRSHH